MEKWKEQFRMDTPEKRAKLGAQDQDKQNTTIHKMQKIKTTTKTNHNMCWTPPYTRRRQNTPQYVLDTTIHKAKTKQTTTHNMLDTTICKQTQITYVCFCFDRNSIFITYMFILLITGYQYLLFMKHATRVQYKNNM